MELVCTCAQDVCSSSRGRRGRFMGWWTRGVLIPSSLLLPPSNHHVPQPKNDQLCPAVNARQILLSNDLGTMPNIPLLIRLLVHYLEAWKCETSSVSTQCANSMVRVLRFFFFFVLGASPEPAPMVIWIALLLVFRTFTLLSKLNLLRSLVSVALRSP